METQEYGRRIPHRKAGGWRGHLEGSEHSPGSRREGRPPRGHGEERPLVLEGAGAGGRLGLQGTVSHAVRPRKEGEPSAPPGRAEEQDTSWRRRWKPAGGVCTAGTVGTQRRWACLRTSLPGRWACSSLKGSVPQVTGEETGSRMGREGFQRPGVLLRRQTFGMWAGSG